MYLTAGLIVPIFATIGSGIDLGQAYMAKSRLQQACDAGVLAGRKIMADGQFTPEAHTAATNMFEFNYPDGIYDSTGVTFTPEARGASEVAGEATATVQTIIMGMFGKEEFNLTVNCAAKLEISNADIMFVLDVTGSMGDTNSGDSVNKITALKTEVMSFYDTVMDAETGDSQIRWGVVPYSQNVNVGRVLYASNPSWISTSLNIPSRVSNFPVTSTTSPTISWSNVSGFSSWTTSTTTPGPPLTQSGGTTSTLCNAIIPSPEYVNGTTNGAPVTSTSTSTSGNSVTTTTYVDQNYNAVRYRYRRTGSPTACRLQQANGVRRERTTSSETRTISYTYRMINYNVTNVLNGSGLTMPLGDRAANVTASWNGCIMERDTVSIAANATTIPSGAYDIDVNKVPDSEATRWHISLPNFTFPRTGGLDSDTWTQNPSPADYNTSADYTDYASNGYTACPVEVMTLREIPTSNRATFNTYVQSLQPTGNTYHDAGMVWGTRLISPTGLYASTNASAPNGNPISRHVVFMTDGVMVPNLDGLTFQGVESLHRRTGATSWSDARDRHNRRFLAVCDAAKALNITVWVVSFGVSLDSSMRACASGDKAYQANNSAQLRTQFQAIAQQITRLRLSE